MLAFQMSKEPTVKPMPQWVALIYFGASAAVFRMSIYVLLPFLINVGLVPFWAFLISYGLVLSLMMVASLIALKQEGSPLTLRAFSKRFRFKKLSGRAWLWTLGAFVVGFLATAPLVPSQISIARIPIFSPPAFFPSVLNPLAPKSLALTEFMGVPLRGNWWFAAVYLIFLSWPVSAILTEKYGVPYNCC